MMQVEDNANEPEDADEMLAHLDTDIATEEKEMSPQGVGEQQQNDELSRALRGKMEIWNLEQQIVASIVHIEPDPPIDTSLVGDNPLFHILQDDHHDVYSFSSKPELFGGVDVSFPSDPSQQAVAVYVIVDKRTMEVVYSDHKFFTLDVPYVPGYLAFREIRPLEMLVHRQVEQQPELIPQAIFVDGNGILHPRHAGIACFLGTRLNIPTIGIGKTLYYEGGWTRENVDTNIDHFLNDLKRMIQKNSKQTLASPLSRYRGLIMKKLAEDPPTPPEAADPANNSDETPYDRKEALKSLATYCNGVSIPLKNTRVDDVRFSILGCALVGQGGQIAASAKSEPVAGTSKAIFVSVGHKVSLHRAVQVTASLCLARIPEPVRQADLIGRDLLRTKTI